MQVAQTILAQIGGNRFVAMTGAKQFVGGADSLQFSLSSTMTKNKANKVRITLTADDRYTVEFYNLRGVNLREISKFEGVYADGLAALFTEQTGLSTSL